MIKRGCPVHVGAQMHGLKKTQHNPTITSVNWLPVCLLADAGAANLWMATVVWPRARSSRMCSTRHFMPPVRL